MPARRPTDTPDCSSRNAVEALAEQFIRRLRRGEYPSVAEYAEQHPELADQIRDLFPTLGMLEKCGQRHPRDGF